MTKTVELNTKLTAVRDFISDTVEARGYPPTMREISTHFGIKSTSSVSYYLKKLEDAGELKINSRLSRGIELKDKKLPSSRLQSVPMVGRVTAGSPRLAFDEYAIAVTKGQTELLEAINEVLNELLEDVDEDGNNGIQQLVMKHLDVSTENN